MDGRRFGIVTVVDDFTHKCLALVPDNSLCNLRARRELDGLNARRGKPQTTVTDNGAEFTSLAILH